VIRITERPLGLAYNMNMQERTGRSSTARTLVAALVGYLMGTLPSADLAARGAARRNGTPHHDLREHGTGNPGGLNASKVLGTKWGMAVMAADIAKGAAASIAGRRIAGDAGAYAAGAGAVIGHCLPVWSGFRGGKGIATSAGTAAVCFPAYTPFDLAVAGGTLGLSRGQANLAAFMSSSIFTAASFLWWRRGRGNLWGPAPTRGLPVYAALTSAVICWRFYSARQRTPVASNTTPVSA